MRTVIITGGLGCGKSTLAKLLANELGGQVGASFSADAVVHDLYAREEVRERIARGLGIQAPGCDPSGDEFRKLVRHVVVCDMGARRCLEQILHPLVWEAFREMGRKFEGLESNVLLAEIPLYYETKAPIAVDLAVAVAASQATQIHRLCCFRSVEKVAAKKMLGMQLPLETKVQRADLVIWNDGNLRNLRSQSVMLSKFIKQKYFNYGTSD